MSMISTLLEDYTANNSRFETIRNYVSLSHIYNSVDEIVKQYFEGFEDSKQIRLRCYKGYQMEDDMLRRVGNVFGKRAQFEIEINAFDGLVKGHPDFLLDGYPGDFKSVPEDEYLPFSVPERKIPARIFWQMQAYLHFEKSEKGLLLYESRASGKINDYWIKYAPNVGSKIQEKIEKVVSIIKAKS